MARKQKTIRLDYWDADPKLAASISILGNPSEVRLSASSDSFISIQEDGISIGGSRPSKVSIQGLSNSMKYAGGMIQDLPFPLSTLPTTPATPFPKQIFVPPMNEMMSTIRLVAQYSSLLPV